MALSNEQMKRLADSVRKNELGPSPERQALRKSAKGSPSQAKPTESSLQAACVPLIPCNLATDGEVRPPVITVPHDPSSTFRSYNNADSRTIASRSTACPPELGRGAHRKSGMPGLVRSPKP